MRPRGKPNLYSVGPRYASALNTSAAGLRTSQLVIMSWLVLGRDSAAQFPASTTSAGRSSKTLQQFQRLLLDSEFHTRFAYLAPLEETS